MHYETPRMNLESKPLIEAVCLIALVAARQLDALASRVPAEVSGMPHEGAPNTGPAQWLMNDKRGDATYVSNVVEQRGEVDTDQSDNSHRDFGHPGPVGLTVCEVTNVGTNCLLRHGIS